MSQQNQDICPFKRPDTQETDDQGSSSQAMGASETIPLIQASFSLVEEE